MPLDVAIFHESQRRKTAPPQLSAFSATGYRSTTLPSPSGTRNIMRPMPLATPRRHGSPCRRPTFAPAAVSMMLLGPGVTAATTAKRRNATTCSVVVLYLLCAPRRPDPAAWVLNDRASVHSGAGSPAP